MSTELHLKVDPSGRVPLATQLSRQLEWLIASGRLREGDQLPPVRELAEQIGINLHTVRAAYQQLSDDGLVSVQRGRRAKVLRYDRTRPRPSWADVPSYSIGVVIPEFFAFYEPFLDAIEAATAERPAMVFVCNAHSDRDTALAYLDRLVARQVDGIIMTGGFVPDADGFPPRGKPALVFHDSPNSPGPAVDFDLEGSQYMATRHLIEHGHGRIGFVTPPLDWPVVEPKYAGYKRALAEVGIPFDSELVAEIPDFLTPSGEEGAARLLDSPNPPTAIAALADRIALGVHHAITARGLRIPEDVALVGNDDIEMAAFVRPALTTVALPVAESGRLAAAMLEQILGGEQPDPDRIVLGTELVTRDSCGCRTTG